MGNEMGTIQNKPKRILIVDDNKEIHKDFYKILTKKNSSPSDEGEAMLFGETTTPSQLLETREYRLDSAHQGKEALEMVRTALSDADPYALAFVDIRMPPGWNGIETIKQIWAVDPNVQMVICSAYSDHSWEDITRELVNSDNLLILKKPFEIIEICQLASALTKKWDQLANLHLLVKNRTSELENLYSLTKTTLESVKEGILAVGLDGCIITYNDIFLKQWGVAEELLKTEKFPVVLQKIAENIEDSVIFLKMMNDSSKKSEVGKIKEWQLKTGAILELFTHPQFLKNEIIGIVYSFQDITERKKLESQLLHQATHDVLTGLPNRALFLDRIKQSISNAKRFDLYVGVLVIDLDFFKDINDRFGHKVGDLVIQNVSNRMSNFIRESDTIARIGGDEFVGVFAAQTREENFLGLLTRFLEIFTSPCQIDGHNISMTASIGVSIYPRDGEDIDTLLKNADAALYKAKELGRNRFQFYIEEFNKKMLQNSEIRRALSHALEKNELSLNYQPLLDLKSNKIIGVEALIRWTNPDMGVISPQTFIPIAEESGLIISVGEWVLKTACKQAKIWHQSSAFPALKISVNVSVKQFREENFVPTVLAILKETNLDPHCLELEITEGLILTDIDKTIQKMNELKKIGVHFAIDDFGSGYSALNYLKYFQFDTVKIDKAFIDNLPSDAGNASIVEAIIAMTKNMNINVLAEGVERGDQVKFLREHHSDQVQGYYFSKPLDEQTCTELLKHNKVVENKPK